ncbi:MAG TPA: DUF1360 domain-containing protein [Candidatus Paceibacterota bacterium]|nr:DUF1360 domain-containing protein [Candidatus Paceibacterota bacterium]
MATQTRLKEDQNFWNVVFSVFFLLVLVFALWSLYRARGSFPTFIPVFDAVMLSFASFRITRLIVYDKITRFFRELFVHRREVVHDGKTYVELTPYENGVLHTMNDLLQCPWCIGLWAGLIATYAYFMFPWAWFVLLFLALSGLGSLLQLIGNLIGWRAENLKLDANSKEKLGHTSDRSGL